MGELADPDCFDAFVMTPEDYICGARWLQHGADQVKASRRGYSALIGKWDVKTLAFWGGLAAIVGLVVWRRRRRSV